MGRASSRSTALKEVHYLPLVVLVAVAAAAAAAAI
jgi:hypothetical protein